VRPTFDVDAIAEISSYPRYDAFSERLKKLGFQEDTREGAPPCRWRQKTTTLDVMSLDFNAFRFLEFLVSSGKRSIRNNVNSKTV
jgi:hypothetical protein